MSDDKKNTGARDRATVSASEDYEVEDFARKWNVTPQKVRELIRKFDGNRARMEAGIKEGGG